MSLPDPEVTSDSRAAVPDGPAVTERAWLDHLPFAVDLREFQAGARGLDAAGACCVFVVDSAIPQRARGGYACLLIAFSRSGEPVTIFEDGSAALLIRDGATASARIAALRVLHQAARLRLERTLRVGIEGLEGRTVDEAIARARRAAHTAAPGEIADLG